jgi:hypothetical protein
MPEDPGQLEFDFDASTPRAGDQADGFARWQAEIRAEDEAEARRLGLPLRQFVEVQLKCGALLRGRLMLAEHNLLRLQKRPAHLTLRLGNSIFDHSQIARCLVLDLP